jgi:hypothetical protein
MFRGELPLDKGEEFIIAEAVSGLERGRRHQGSEFKVESSKLKVQRRKFKGES